MPVNPSSVESVLGTVSAGLKPPPKLVTDKLASVTVGEPDSFYMLATYCFDLNRKLMYLSKVAQPFANSVPPDLAQQILADTVAINADGLTWQQRAEVAESIMLRVYGELGSS